MAEEKTKKSNEKKVQEDVAQNEEVFESGVVEEKKEAKLKPADVEKKILELAKQGVPPEKIGLILRDKHGVPSAGLFGKKIGKILKEHNLYENSEIKNISAKIENLNKHIERNKHDFSAKRSQITNTSYLNKLRKVSAQ
jgi:ribosomal protein S15P/S13E